MVEKNIRNIFLKYPEVIYGFTDIAYSEYASTYKSALVFAVPYGNSLQSKHILKKSLKRVFKMQKKYCKKWVDVCPRKALHDVQ